MYFPHEKRFVQRLGTEIQNGSQQIVINGPSGCGKSYSVESFLQSYEDEDTKILYLVGDKELIDRDYKPFLDGLSNDTSSFDRQSFQKSITELGESIPSIGKPLKILLNLMFDQNNAKKKSRDSILNEIEQDIVCKIETLSKRYRLIFFCDHFHYWDERSLLLMYIILNHAQKKYKFLSNALFLFTITTDQENSYRNRIDAVINRECVVKLPFPEMEFDDFDIALRMLNYSGSLSITEKKMLHSLVKGHLTMLKELIRELTNKNVDLSNVDQGIKKLLLQVLESRLNDSGLESSKINFVLEYASILGVTFSKFELNRITELENNDFNRIIDNARSMELVHEPRYGQLKFAHEFIRDIFQMKISSQEIVYYRKIEKCISEIAPDHYHRRAQYRFKVGDTNEGLILFVLEIIKQIRENGDVTPSLSEQAQVLLREHPQYLSYVDSMKAAMHLYQKNQYNEAYIKISAINDTLPNQLIAEKQILRSLTYSKKIDADFRKEGIRILSQYASLDHCGNERDIYERVKIRLMTMYIHINELQTARKIEEEIIDSLRERIGHDDTARDRLHRLNLISSSVYDCEIACSKIEEAVAYFGPDSSNNHLWTNLKQYYISLINYSASLCVCGRYQDSFKAAEKARDLMEENPNFDFPRIRISVNNYLLSGYLSGYLKPSECVEGFKGMITGMPLCAERLFYTSNLSIFLALDGKVEEAFETLKLEGNLQASHGDPEKIYNYRVVVNCAVFQYLLGNTEDAIAQLVKIADDKMDSVGGSLMMRRKTELLHFMKTSLARPDYRQWETVLLNSTSEMQVNPWNYYGRGYVFSALNNWDLW